MLDAFLQKGCKMMETFVTIKSIWAFWSYYWFVNALGWEKCSNWRNGVIILNEIYIIDEQITKKESSVTVIGINKTLNKTKH